MKHSIRFLVTSALFMFTLTIGEPEKFGDPSGKTGKKGNSFNEFRDFVKENEKFILGGLMIASGNRSGGLNTIFGEISRKNGWDAGLLALGGQFILNGKMSPEQLALLGSYALSRIPPDKLKGVLGEALPLAKDGKLTTDELQKLATGHVGRALTEEELALVNQMITHLQNPDYQKYFLGSVSAGGSVDYASSTSRSIGGQPVLTGQNPNAMADMLRIMSNSDTVTHVAARNLGIPGAELMLAYQKENNDQNLATQAQHLKDCIARYREVQLASTGIPPTDGQALSFCTGLSEQQIAQFNSGNNGGTDGDPGAATQPTPQPKYDPSVIVPYPNILGFAHVFLPKTVVLTAATVEPFQKFYVTELNSKPYEFTVPASSGSVTVTPVSPDALFLSEVDVAQRMAAAVASGLFTGTTSGYLEKLKAQVERRRLILGDAVLYRAAVAEVKETTEYPGSLVKYGGQYCTSQSRHAFYWQYIFNLFMNATRAICEDLNSTANIDKLLKERRLFAPVENQIENFANRTVDVSVEFIPDVPRICYSDVVDLLNSGKTGADLVRFLNRPFSSELIKAELISDFARAIISNLPETVRENAGSAKTDFQIDCSLLESQLTNGEIIFNHFKQNHKIGELSKLVSNLASTDEPLKIVRAMLSSKFAVPVTKKVTEQNTQTGAIETKFVSEEVKLEPFAVLILTVANQLSQAIVHMDLLNVTKDVIHSIRGNSGWYRGKRFYNYNTPVDEWLMQKTVHLFSSAARIVDSPDSDSGVITLENLNGEVHRKVSAVHNLLVAYREITGNKTR